MDLSNPQNWSLVYSANLQARQVAQYGEGVGSVLVFDPIPPVVATLGTPVGLVVCSSRTAKRNPVTNELEWYTGCWANVYQQLGGHRSRVYRKRCGLENANLLTIPVYVETLPYDVEFYIPKWIEDLRLELWQFTDQSGKYLQSSQQALLSAIEVVEQRERELSAQLEQIRQQISQSTS